MSSLSLATFPTSLNAKTSFLLSPSTARPAESYPLYSSRERPGEHVCQPDFAFTRLPTALLTIDKGVENELSVLLDQVVDVAKDATKRGGQPAHMPFLLFCHRCLPHCELLLLIDRTHVSGKSLARSSKVCLMSSRVSEETCPIVSLRTEMVGGWLSKQRNDLADKKQRRNSSTENVGIYGRNQHEEAVVRFIRTVSSWFMMQVPYWRCSGIPLFSPQVNNFLAAQHKATA